MHALAGERIQIGRERGDQGLALTRTHFRDLALVQRQSADQLHIEMAHTQRTARGFADGGKGFREQLVEPSTVLQTCTELFSFGFELFVGQGLYGRFQTVRCGDRTVVFLEKPLVTAADDAGQEL